MTVFIAILGHWAVGPNTDTVFLAVHLISHHRTCFDLTWADLAQSAGAGPYITEYLEARGIRTTPTLALVAHEREQFIAQVVQPLLDGFQKGAFRVQLEEDEKPIAQAVMEHMWQEARMQWQRRQAAVPLAAPAIPGAAAPANPGTSPGTTTPNAEKAPKQLPAQVWQKQVSRYNGITMDGRPRRFPEKEVLGAEQVLGRVWHEHTVTRAYTPIGLGEILQKRSFTASGEVNPLQKQTKATQLLRIQDDQIVQDEESKQWTPRSILAIMDGVNSIRWAWILLQVGEEDYVHNFADWFIQKIRARPNKLKQMRVFWEAAGWRIAMGMRSGQTFGEATVEVMADVDLFNEAMSKEATKEVKTPLPKKRPANDELAPAPQRTRTSYTWQGSNNSKGSKGNQKGKQNYNNYGGSQRWRTWGSGHQNPYDSSGSGDQGTGR